MSGIMVIGGGLAGLAAAIECVERGVPVELREATGKLGGRARSLERDGFITNQGPHALYLKGPGHRWLEQRGLLPPLVGVKPTAVRLRETTENFRCNVGFPSARTGFTTTLSTELRPDPCRSTSSHVRPPPPAAPRRPLIGDRRGDQSRLGFVPHATTVRYLGVFLEDSLDVPGPPVPS